MKNGTCSVGPKTQAFGLQKKTSPLTSPTSPARRNPAHQKADKARTLRPDQPRTRRATAPRRQDQWEPGRTLAPCTRTLTVGDLGSLVRLDGPPHPPSGAARGAPIGPRGGAVRDRFAPATHPEPKRL